MPTDTFIVVEGVHDVAVVERLLQPDFTRATNREQLPEPWRRFIPTKLANPDLLPIRVPHPVFLRAQDGRSVMIRAAGSDDQISTKLAADLKDLPGEWPASVGILIDADSNAAADRLVWINSKLSDRGTRLEFPGPPGTIGMSGTYRCGAYVLPDNLSPGGIESLLLEGGNRNFPALLSKSSSFVRGIEEADVPRDRDGRDKPWRELSKGDRSKAIVHAVGAILKPSRPTQATLEDDPWFDGSDLPLINGLRRFLRDLVA